METLGGGKEKMDPAPCPVFLAAEGLRWVEDKVSPLNSIPRVDYFTRLGILTFKLRLCWGLKVSIVLFIISECLKTSHGIMKIFIQWQGKNFLSPKKFQKGQWESKTKLLSDWIDYFFHIEQTKDFILLVVVSLHLLNMLSTSTFWDIKNSGDSTWPRAESHWCPCCIFPAGVVRAQQLRVYSSSKWWTQGGKW